MYYITKELSKIWRKFYQEFHVEWPLICEKWKIILFGLIFQYIHGLAAKSVYYFHKPGPILNDFGFAVIPELGKEKEFLSEFIFLLIAISFVLWSIHPFFFVNKRFYSCLLWAKVLTVLSICQFFRIISFSSTILPGPAYHCRLGSPLGTLPPPKNIKDFFLLNITKKGIFGCGDLIFSSHMIFTLVFIITYAKYGTHRWIKLFSLLLAITQSLFIIALRKHYTVDVTIAWYVVPLVFYFVDNQLTDLVGHAEIADRFSSASATQLLPLSNRSKDDVNTERSRSNGVSSASMDNEGNWRQRMAMNGKPNEELSILIENVQNTN